MTGRTVTKRVSDAFVYLTSRTVARYLSGSPAVLLAVELKDIRAIIDLMKKNDLSVFELEKEGFRLKLQKGLAGQPVLVSPGTMALPTGIVAGNGGTAAASGIDEEQEKGAAEGTPLRDIVSPMVGTFYRTPSPETPPFVEVGKQVDDDSVVCIIEAMKVMNEIKAETSGTIAEVVAENGKPVQFGQVLFRVR